MKSTVSSKEISILIPTRNRSDLLITLLRYLCKNSFEGPIYVGDSSDLEQIEKVKSALVTFKGKIDVRYGEYPGRTAPETHLSLASEAATPYAVYMGDDDFVVPSALVQCAAFLEQAPEFSACSGKAVLIAHQNGYPDMAAGFYGGACRDLLDERASQRFLNFMSGSFVTLFAVQRTIQRQEGYQGLDRMPDWAFTELLPSCYSVIQGKIKTIDVLSLVRQHHQGYRHPMPDRYDWLTNENWLPSYQQFANRLASLLSEKDNIPIEQAQKIIKKGFWKYLANDLTLVWRRRYEPPDTFFKGRLKTRMKNIPLATRFWRAFYPYTPGGKMTLKSLLRKSSPYHTDFLPVYQAIRDTKSTDS